jgi:ATP-dependent protease Clp ATPase subunit
MFELPSLEGVEKVVISQEVVEGTAPPLYQSNARANVVPSRDLRICSMDR